MTVIAIQCPTCRTTDDIPAPALFIDVDAPGDPTGDDLSASDATPAASVTWVCGSCAELVSVTIDWVPLLAVVSAGATLLDTSLGIADSDDSDRVGAEGVRPAHPESPTSGAALTADDLLDFHEGLRGADWLDELTVPG